VPDGATEALSGETVRLITVTVALADCVGSAWLVAVTVCVPTLGGAV